VEVSALELLFNLALSIAPIQGEQVPIVTLFASSNKAVPTDSFAISLPMSVTIAPDERIVEGSPHANLKRDPRLATLVAIGTATASVNGEEALLPHTNLWLWQIYRSFDPLPHTIGSSACFAMGW
jgi:hypothetical protein